ncbi:cytochrome c-type biogenesis protein [Amorphus sp. 3PC139-8]|uniref:cytochrome c-type biogenesis protein n=1 Tax=Amorphus sp. 3PC139-8 TaxID=2735676 RepID=UPI00345CC673
MIRGARAIAAAGLLLLGLALPAVAVQPDEMLDNPKLEARARELSEELRCLVCQNESIDASNAPLARDIRILLRERIKAGDSDEQVMDFLVARYGEFVLLKPRFNAHTWLLWLTPVLVLVAGGLVAAFGLRRRRSAGSAPLSASEEAELETLLNGSSNEAGR